RTRDWLAGERMSYADLAAAAHLSVVDYLGDVPWDEDEAAKAWYARVKSRPSFRPLLADIHGGIQPSKAYADPDFCKIHIRSRPRLGAPRASTDSIPSASRPRTQPRSREIGSHSFSPPARTATWAGSPMGGVAIRARCGRPRAPSSCLDSTMDPIVIRLRFSHIPSAPQSPSMRRATIITTWLRSASRASPNG